MRSNGCPLPLLGDGRVSAGRVPASSPSRHAEDDVPAAPLLEISNAMVRLYKEAFGRGPTKARTTFAGPDTLLVVLENAFTVTERTLLALGEIDGLQKARLVVQEALEERARSAVERVLGRQTLAYVTGIDPRRAVAVNLFTLESVAVADGDHDGAGARTGRSR